MRLIPNRTLLLSAMLRFCAAALFSAAILAPPWSSPILLAAIQIFPLGSGVQTFNSAPPASDWSTVLTGINDTSSSIGQIMDESELDFVVQQVSAANVNATLPISNLLSPTANQAARYSMPGQFVQTYTTSAMASVLMATLQNSTGNVINQLNVAYDLAEVLEDQEVRDEQIPGQRLYYSATGAANSWTPISTFANPGQVSFSIAPLNWSHGSNFYLLWADDNSIPGATMGEAAYTLDNVSFNSLITPDPPQITIDFENVPDVTPMGFFNGTASTPANWLSTQLLASHGVRFRSESPNPDYVALVALGTGHATSGRNGIGAIDEQNNLDYTGPMLIDFFMPGSGTIPATTNFFSIRGDNSGIGFVTVTLDAFDVNGMLLGSTSGVDTSGATFSIAFPGMHRIRITESSGTVGLDDLTINTLQPVPEPSSLFLGCIGALSLTGWVLRPGRR